MPGFEQKVTKETKQAGRRFTRIFQQEGSGSIKGIRVRVSLTGTSKDAVKCGKQPFGHEKLIVYSSPSILNHAAQIPQVLGVVSSKMHKN